jgi:tricorn protease
MKKSYYIALLFIIIAATAFAQKPRTETKLLRFPDIHFDQIVFVYAGDIYTVPSVGGTARQLTTFKGEELFPKISPDGRWIAFSAEYTGNRQVYIMPAEGGTPKQLTYYNPVGNMPPRGGYDYQILGWTPDSKNVLFLANRTPWGERMSKYYTINIDGGLEKGAASSSWRYW